MSETKPEEVGPDGTFKVELKVEGRTVCTAVARNDMTPQQVRLLTESLLMQISLRRGAQH